MPTCVPFSTTVPSHAGVGGPVAKWETGGHPRAPRPHPPAVLVLAVLPLASRQELTTPVLFLTTVPYRVGERVPAVNWVTEEHLTKPRQPLRAALGLDVQPSLFHPECITHVPFWITVRSRAGERGLPGNWVVGGAHNKTRPPSRAALVLAVPPLLSRQEVITPVPFLTMVPSRVGDSIITVNWETVGHLAKPRPPSRAALVLAALPLRSLREITTPVLFLITVPCRVGDLAIKGNWATVVHRTNTRQHLRAALVLGVRLTPSQLETVTPVPSLTTVPCRAGVRGAMENWATVGHRTNTRQHSRAALVLAGARGW